MLAKTLAAVKGIIEVSIKPVFMGLTHRKNIEKDEVDNYHDNDDNDDLDFLVLDTIILI